MTSPRPRARPRIEETDAGRRALEFVTGYMSDRPDSDALDVALALMSAGIPRAGKDCRWGTDAARRVMIRAREMAG